MNRTFRMGAIAIVVATIAGCQPHESQTGSQAAPGPGAASATDPVDQAVVDPLSHALTRHAWMATDANRVQGTLRILLADGSMFLGSCGETYRLVRWRMAGDSLLVWNEDGMDIRAHVLAVSDSALALRLDLVQGSEVEYDRAAPVPYLCPDLRK